MDDIDPSMSSSSPTQASREHTAASEQQQQQQQQQEKEEEEEEKEEGFAGASSSTMAEIVSTGSDDITTAIVSPRAAVGSNGGEAQEQEAEGTLHKVRNLVRRIVAARPSPHPRFLHTLASILEQQEARFQEETGHSTSNNARSSHTIGHLANSIRENDDFYELLSSKLLVEARHSTAVYAASARLLLACLSCGMYPDAFEDAVLTNIKQWVVEDAAKHFLDGIGAKKPGHIGATRVTKSEYADWEMLKTYATGLLAIALTAGGGVVEDVLTTGVPSKLMHYLRIRVLKETHSQREPGQMPESSKLFIGNNMNRNKEDGRSRAKLPVEASRPETVKSGEECVDGRSVKLIVDQAIGVKSILEESKADEEEVVLGTGASAYHVDDGAGSISDDRQLKLAFQDGDNRENDLNEGVPPGREDNLDNASSRSEFSKHKGDGRDKSSKLRVRSRGPVDVIAQGEKVLASCPAVVQGDLENTRSSIDKSCNDIDVENELIESKDNVTEQCYNPVEAEIDTHGDDQDSLVRGLDISSFIKKAVRAAEAEAKAAKASVEAVNAAGEAAAELVKSAAIEVLEASNDKNSALGAAAAAAATVVDAAAATKARRRDPVPSSGLSKDEAENRITELNMQGFADLDDCVLDTESLAKLRERYSVQCLEKLGEYLEVLGPVLHERGIDVCLALLQRESGDSAIGTDKTMLSDVLKLICALAAHRKFAALFVDKGGLLQLLAVPRIPQTYTGISLCLFALASLQVVMERVCTLPSDVLNKVTELALYLLECPQDSARRNAALFFGAAFVFKAIIDAFDAHDGLSKMLHVLGNAASLRSGGGIGILGSSSMSTVSRTDRAASAEVLTSSDKQIAYHTCVALRQYFRAQLMILVDSLRPYKGRSGLRTISTSRAAYKPLDLSNEAIDSITLQLQRDRKLGPAFVRARWPALEKFISYNGHIILLELTQVAPGERYLYEIAQHALGVLQIVTLMPYARRLIVGSTLSNERSGMAVILDAASAAGFADPEVIQPALLVLVNLVCPPPSLSSRPNPPGNTSVTGTFEGRDRPAKGEASVDRNVDRTAWQNEAKERISKVDGEPSGMGAGSQSLPLGSLQTVGGSSSPSVVVGERRISLGSWGGGPGLAAYMEQGYRQAREAVRANNGIKVLLHLLYPRTFLPPTSLDCIRALACRVLLGLARDDAIAHILTKLQVGKLLTELLRDGGCYTGRSAGVSGGGENVRWQAELGQMAMELMGIVTNAGRASTLVGSDATAPTLRRIERAAIAAATPISYHPRELLLLIHEHLVAAGLTDSAATLMKEAQLVPLPSNLIPSNIPNQSATLEPLIENWQWPTGRTPDGFFIKNQHLKEDETPSKSDQNLIRKRGPSFSSTVLSGCKTPLPLPSACRKQVYPKDIRPAAVRKASDLEVIETPRVMTAEAVDDAIKITVGSLPTKRKALDKDTLLLPPNKRHALCEYGGSMPSFSTPPRYKSSSLQENGGLLCSPLSSGQYDAQSRQVPGQTPASSILEKPLSMSFQNENNVLGDNHLCTEFHTSKPIQSQTSFLFHANFLPDSISSQTERATLDSLVVQYLKHQHRQCPAPITTLPPLSLFHPHVCPEPSRACSAPANIAGRIFSRQMVPHYGGVLGHKRDCHFVYSRFKPWRTCRDEGVLLTCATFFGSEFHLAAGSHSGEIKIFDCSSGNTLETHVGHQSPISMLHTAQRDLTSSAELTGFHASQLLASSSSSDVRIWNTSDLSQGPLYSFDGCRSAHFNHSGSLIAAISSDPSHREVLLYDVQTGKLENRILDNILISAGSSRTQSQSFIHFNPFDTLLLWNGVLWDYRVPVSVHRFDQFTDYGGGGFHPAGNEVLINSEVWDLRSYKLLRSVPSLDQTVITFNPTGDVIYATLRRNSEDVMSAFHHRRSRHPLFAAFRTIDAVDYTDIATVPVDRCILDLAIEPTDSLIAVVAMDGSDEIDSFARLYEIGRRRPAEDDSDPDDGIESEDEEESEAEELAEDENLLDDDSEVDGSNGDDNDDDASGDDDEVEEDGDAEFDSADEEDDEDAVDLGEGILEIISDEEEDDIRLSYSTDESPGEFEEDFDNMLHGFF